MSCKSSCDYCFVVQHPDFDVQPARYICGFPSTLFFFNPWESPFTFGENQLDKEHLHVHVPTKVTSSFIGKGGEFLVNSDKSFLIFSPLKQKLTYEEVLYPSDETHNLIVPVSNTHHKISPGSVIVGIDYNSPRLFVCFAYFMNGAKIKAEMPVIELMFNSTRMVYYFQQIKEELKKKICNPQEKIAFKSEFLNLSGERLKGFMPTISGVFLSKTAIASNQAAGGSASVQATGSSAPVQGGAPAAQTKKDTKHTAEQDEVSALKRAKTNGK